MSDRPPGAGWYVLGAASALGGLALAAALVVRFVLAMPEPVRFIAPGGGALVLAERPGRYVIWHEYHSIFDGRSYAYAAALPGGVQFRVLDPSGRAVTVSPSGGATWKSGAAERASIAEFEAAAPGRYSVRAEGDFEPRVFAVLPSMMKALWTTAASAVAAAVIGVGAGFAAGLYGFLRYASAVPAVAVTAIPRTADERRLRQLAALGYGLQAAAFVVGVTLIAAAVIGYLKRGEAQGSWIESHFRWQIRTFWWTLAWTVLGVATVVVGVGIVILVASAIWLIYRIARGWTRLNDGLPA